MKLNLLVILPHLFFLAGFVGCYPVVAQNQPDTTIHIFADTMPEFPGGKDSLFSFISNHFKYPQEAIKNNVQGKVYLHFVIEPDGVLSNIKVLKGIGDSCDEEALRIVTTMAKWSPGWLDGKKVRVSYNLLIPFRMKIIENPIYLRVDSLPKFDVGNGQLESYIQQNLLYPITILNDSLIDTVPVLFVVGKDKSISQVKLRNEKKEMDAYDYEAIRVVNELPVLTPAYLKGQPVSMYLYVPVIFDYSIVDTTDSKMVFHTFSGKEFSYYQPNPIYCVVEQMPEFPGGMGAMMKYLASTIHFPKKAKKTGVQGKVFINFVVEPDGSVSHVRVLRGIGSGCDKEAVRVVRNMPKWKPGIQKGKPVRVSFNLPIKFTLYKNGHNKKQQ